MSDVPERPRKYSSKSGMILNLKATIPLKKSHRALELSNHTSRVVNGGEIHEFLIANDYQGDKVGLNDISYVGFFQFDQGGLIEIGDPLIDPDGNIVGRIIGFDYTHLADGTHNHMNIVLESNTTQTGTERGYTAGQEFRIKGYEIDHIQKDAVSKVSEVLFELFNKLGIRNIFGFPGETSFSLYEGLSKFKGRHIIATDERMAAHMADAYARVTNQVGVLEIPKVGALWVPPATLEALESSVPMLIVSTSGSESNGGRHPTCDYDQLELLKPVTKECFKIDTPDNLVATIKKALQSALSGKPGPVFVEIPSNVLAAKARSIDYEVKQTIECPIDRPIASEESIREALALLTNSRNPIIIAGGGVHQSQAYKELFEFSDKLRIPVATTINGKGSFDETHSLSVGVVGDKGDIYSNAFLKTADLLLVIGSKLGDKSSNQYTLLDAGARLIHLDIDPAEIGHVFEANAGMVGDAKATLAHILKNLAEHQDTNWHFDDRSAELEMKRKQRFEMYNEYEAAHMAIAPSLLFKSLNDIFQNQHIIVADGSTACGWASVFSKTIGGIRANINPRGSGMIGYGLPATVGAVAAGLDRQIIGVGGDGGFKSTVHGIETAVQYKLDMTFFILDDQRLTFMNSIFEEAYGISPLPKMPSTDWETIARGFGANAVTLEINQSLSEFLESHTWKGVNIVVLKINKDIKSPDLLKSIEKNKKRAK